MAGGRWNQDRGDACMTGAIGTFYPLDFEGGSVGSIGSSAVDSETAVVIRSLLVGNNTVVSIQNALGTVTYLTLSQGAAGLSHIFDLNIRLPKAGFRVVSSGTFTLGFSLVP